MYIHKIVIVRSRVPSRRNTGNFTIGE